MSQSSTMKLRCSQCGENIEITIWQSVNVRTDPSMKEELLGGQFFTYACQKCGSQQAMIYRMLYHDPDQKYMVWLVPPPELQDAGLDTEEMHASLARLENYHFRVVLSEKELVEKIRIFDQNLDDRLVESLKASLWELRKCRTDLGHDSLVFSELVKKGSNGQATLILVQSVSDDAPITYHITWREYEEMALKLHISVDKRDPEPPRFHRIDDTYWEQITKGKR
jgi:hypothetical protein